MVSWIKGQATGPFTLLIDNQAFDLPRIASHLQLHSDTSSAADIAANGDQAPQGVSFGHPAFRAGSDGFGFTGNGVRPRAGANDMLRGVLRTEPEPCIYLLAGSEHEARTSSPEAFAHLKKRVYPWIKERVESGKDTGDYASWFKRWWRPQKPRDGFLRTLHDKHRVLVCPRVMARSVFAYLSTAFVPDNTLILFALDDDYSFGIMQSGLHWEWVKAQGSKVRTDIQYTTAVWRTFPWPQDPTEEQVAAVSSAARTLRRTRETLMDSNGWSLRQLYQAAEVEGPHPLKEAQAALDAAAADAYGVPPDQSPTEFLLEMNQLVAEDEEQDRKVRGPGLPDHRDPKDPRWMSSDCIEPPAVEN